MAYWSWLVTRSWARNSLTLAFRVANTVHKSSGTYKTESALASWGRLGSSLMRSEEHTSELQSLAYLVCRIIRSKEHTSELQSLAYLVCRLLLEKKKNLYRSPLAQSTAKRATGTRQDDTLGPATPEEPCARAG